MENEQKTEVEKIDVLEIVKQLMAIWPAGGEAPTAERLIEDLPAEAIMGPKRDKDGNVLKTADANMTGYKPAYVIRAAVERLGAGGWVEYCTMGPETDVYLSRNAAEQKKPDGIGVSCHMVIWFPTLNTFRVALGSGAAAVRGDYEKSLADATKAAQTNARKRALALIGIGWKGYTDDMSPDDHADEPPMMPGRPKDPAKRYEPPKPSAPPAPKPTPRVEDLPRTEEIPTLGQAMAAGDEIEQAFQDVVALLVEDGVISSGDKGIGWFRDRARDWGFFDSTGDGGAKVQLIEKTREVHADKLKSLHAGYKEVFGDNEAGRRAWMKELVKKDSTADCTLNERIYLSAKLADKRRGGGF